MRLGRALAEPPMGDRKGVCRIDVTEAYTTGVAHGGHTLQLITHLCLSYKICHVSVSTVDVPTGRFNFCLSITQSLACISYRR